MSTAAPSPTFTFTLESSWRSPSSLRVCFPKQRFFLGDAQLEIWLDGALFHVGSFRQGFDRTLMLTPGRHVLSARLTNGPIARTREYEVEVHAGHATVLTLGYSRFWGNLVKRPSVTTLPN